MTRLIDFTVSNSDMHRTVIMRTPALTQSSHSDAMPKCRNQVTLVI